MDVLVAYKSANDLTIQLITLATGILALSITFMRDVIKSDTPTWALKGSWMVFLLSVCFGIWTLMAITGSVFEVTTGPEELKKASYGSNIMLPSSLQILSFVTGMVFLIIFCVRTMKSKKKKRPRTMWGRLSKTK